MRFCLDFLETLRATMYAMHHFVTTNKPHLPTQSNQYSYLVAIKCDSQCLLIIQATIDDKCGRVSSNCSEVLYKIYYDCHSNYIFHFPTIITQRKLRKRRSWKSNNIVSNLSRPLFEEEIG